MSKNLGLLFLILVSISCNSKNDKELENDLVIIKEENFDEKNVDTIQERNYIAIFDEKTEKKSKLNDDELHIIKIHLENSVDKYNEKIKIRKENLTKQEKEENLKWGIEENPIDLRYYYRQYIISINSNGDKIVRVFCFCRYIGYWKNEIIRVHDGGNCYLNAEINLTKNKTEYFGTNGTA